MREQDIANKARTIGYTLGLLASLLWLVSTPAFGATCQDGTGKTVRLPAADKAGYQNFQDVDRSGNPVVSAQADGSYTLTVSTTPNPRRNLTFEDTLTALDHQSCDAWKLGAVVFVGESALRSPDASGARVEEEMLRLKKAIERKGIVVILVPSA